MKNKEIIMSFKVSPPRPETKEGADITPLSEEASAILELLRKEGPLWIDQIYDKFEGLYAVSLIKSAVDTLVERKCIGFKRAGYYVMGT